MTGLDHTHPRASWRAVGVVAAVLLFGLSLSACIIGPKHEDPADLATSTDAASDAPFGLDGASDTSALGPDVGAADSPPPSDSGAVDASGDASKTDGGGCGDGGLGDAGGDAADAADGGGCGDAGDGGDAGPSDVATGG